MRLPSLCALVAVLLVALLPALAQAEEAAPEPTPAPAAPVLRPAAVRGTYGNELLSNELDITRYAMARDETPIYRFPMAGAARLGTLRFMTEDGFPEIYIVLASRIGADLHVWMQVRIPGRPNGRVGWVHEDRLGDLQVVNTRLHVRRGVDARLYRNNRLVWRAPVATGAPSTPTPAGSYWIREKFRGPGGAFGPYVFGTAAYSVLSDWPRGGVVGIHGTDQPGLIPGSPSHGCIRVRNDKVTQLYRLMPIGTPLLIT
jgi:hypothetical protein